MTWTDRLSDEINEQFESLTIFDSHDWGFDGYSYEGSSGEVLLLSDAERKKRALESSRKYDAAKKALVRKSRAKDAPTLRAADAKAARMQENARRAKRIVELRAEGWTTRQIAKELRCGLPTIGAVLREAA